MSAQQIRPARVWYWVAGAMAVGAVVWLALGLVLGFWSLGRQIDGFQRVPLPGQGQVSLTDAGDYILYYEGPGASEGTIPEATVSLAPVGGDAAIPLSNYSGSLTYDLSGHSGRAVLTFTIDTPGEFLLSTESAIPAGQADIAVSQSIAGKVVRTVLVAVVGAGLLFLAAVALAVVVAIRRRRAPRMPPSAHLEAPTEGPVRGAQA